MRIEELEKGYHIAANVVAKYGDVYLPIFERLHKELKDYKKRNKYKELANRVALGYNDNK